jgi:hypothetical protein
MSKTSPRFWPRLNDGHPAHFKGWHNGDSARPIALNQSQAGRYSKPSHLRRVEVSERH